MKTKILTSIIFFLILSNIYAQDRTNKSLPNIASEALWSLDKATGWMLGSDGQWLEGKNKIQKEGLGSADSKKFNEGLFKLGTDNFSKIEIRKIKIEGVDFYILLKHFITHKYMFPTDIKDHSMSAITFLVFKPNSAEKQRGQDFYELSLYYMGVVDNSDDYIKTIRSEINDEAIKHPWISTSDGTTVSLKVYHKLSDTDKSVSRFFINTSEDIVNSHLLLPIPQSLGLDKKPLNDYYFEVDVTQTKGLLDLIIKKQKV